MKVIKHNNLPCGGFSLTYPLDLPMTFSK